MDNQISQTICDAVAFRSHKRARTGFTNICCPMCPSQGESPDRKFRCGVLQSGNSIIISCFNCKFHTAYTLGHPLGYKMRDFIAALGIGARDVMRLVYWAEQVRSRSAVDPELQETLDSYVPPDYPAMALPECSKPLQEWVAGDCLDPWFLRVAQHLMSRGNTIFDATTYYWTPNTEHHLNRHLIIPCRHQRRLVGWIARAVDPRLVRYRKQTPSDFLFNMDVLELNQRRYVLIVEGAMDALAIDGIAALGGSLNDKQVAWIEQCGKQPIVVPDRDRQGGHLVSIAIDQNWAVATPHYGRHQWWDADIKDAAEAVGRYGKLYTLQSILATLSVDHRSIRMRTSYSLSKLR